MIRKTLTSICAALALAGGLVAPVAAKDITTQAVYFDSLSFGDGLDTSGMFGDAFAKKGASFDDVFLFFSPPVDSQISFDATADYLKGKPSVNFTGMDFGVFNFSNYDAQGNLLGVNVSSLATDQSYLTKFSLGGESADFLGSGIYFVEVKGFTKLAGGGFSGNINTTAIPEPGSLSLLLAGLGLIATLVRRRKRIN
jgi:hypothetical protein